jgi:hypothetical protein
MDSINGTCVFAVMGRYRKAEFDPATVHDLKLVVVK